MINDVFDLEFVLVIGMCSAHHSHLVFAKVQTLTDILRRHEVFRDFNTILEIANLEVLEMFSKKMHTGWLFHWCIHHLLDVEHPREQK